MQCRKHGRGSVLRQAFSLLLLDCLLPLSQSLNNSSKRLLTRLTRWDGRERGRIDLAGPQSIGALVLEVEETQISMSPTGVEHREIHWRRATLPEAKMVLEAYHGQQNLATSATFTATAPAG